MAATLGRSGIQPPQEGCLDPVITVDILALRIEEKYGLQGLQRPAAPNGHFANIDASIVAKGITPLPLVSLRPV
jgi:hypothetical protein